MQPNVAEIAADRPPTVRGKTTIRGKRHLLTIECLDHRTRASRRARQLARAFMQALGDRLADARRPMVEAAAMLAAIAEDAQARRLSGDPGVTINDVVRADGAARRAVRDLALPDEPAEPLPKPSFKEYVAKRAAEAAAASTASAAPSQPVAINAPEGSP